MMSNPTQTKESLTKTTHVGTVVQEYMDNLLVDLFPEVDVEAQSETDMPIPTAEPVLKEVEAAPIESKIETKAEPSVSAPVLEPDAVDPIEEKAVLDTSSQTLDSQPETLRYPQAPPWAQQAFDVLLFDVCGLKLAVPMEALGKIIKVEHETNQLIGRPDWFIGAYIDNEQHLYVVDTAKYIMPEKGFNLADEGFDYIIQLQRSKWTLACKRVHSTIRLEPEQVKWRSQHGKRKWLSGTVVDHMCALVHVDSLISLLESEIN